MDERLITVTGYGTIHVVPDITRIELSLVSLHDTYDAAYAQAKADVDRLQNIMKAVELSTDIPKTMNLDIEKKTRSEYDKNDHYKGKIFLGFELNHKIKIDLGMDTVLLNNMIKLIGKKSNRLKSRSVTRSRTPEPRNSFCSNVPSKTPWTKPPSWPKLVVAP